MKVQVRSVLLQGLVSVTPAELPEPLLALHEPLSRLSQAAVQNGITNVDVAIAWAASFADIELAVLGVTSAAELRQCAEAFQRRLSLDWPTFACDDASVVDPRQWPKGMRVAA